MSTDHGPIVDAAEVLTDELYVFGGPPVPFDCRELVERALEVE